MSPDRLGFPAMQSRLEPLVECRWQAALCVVKQSSTAGPRPDPRVQERAELAEGDAEPTVASLARNIEETAVSLSAHVVDTSVDRS